MVRSSMALWRGFALVGTLTLTTGCPFGNQAVTDSMQREYATAAMRVQQLETTLGEADSRITQLEATLRRQGEEKVTQLETIEEVNTEIARIRGDIELVRRDLDTLKSGWEKTELGNEKRRLHLERRVTAIEGLFGLTPPPPPTDEELGIALAPTEPVDPDATPEPGVVEGDPFTTPVPEPVEPPTSGLESAEDYLEKAVQLMQDGSNKGARALLETAVKQFPSDAAVPELKYRIAETHYNDAEYAKAIGKFEEVVQGFPKSEWAAWSMLRQGDAFKEQGQADNARLFYEQVIRVYPKTEAAADAKRLLGK